MGHCVDCFIQVIECEGPRPSCSIDACMCSVDGHGYNMGTCFGLHYIYQPLQGHWGKSVQVKIPDVIQLSRRSSLVSFPWFLRKYHRTIPVSTAACERGFSKINIFAVLYTYTIDSGTRIITYVCISIWSLFCACFAYSLVFSTIPTE